MSNDDIPAFQPAPFVNGRRGLLARSLVDNLRLIRRVPYARAVIPATGELAITHIGHATNLIQTASASVLTDPIWGKRALLVKRRVRPGLRLRDLPNLDAIVVSHAHFDHLHRRTLKRLPNDVPLVIYKGMESLVEDLGFERIISLQWWETVQLGGATVHAVPSNH